MTPVRSCLCLAVLSTFLVAADTTPPAKSADKKAAPPSIELLKLPSGTVVVVCDDVKEALRLMPRAVVLTPEAYQELLEQVEQLKRQLKTDKPEPPSVCKLTGQVEGDQARLKARYEFRTDKPRALVSLGGVRAWPTAASLDDNQLPLLQQGDDGLVVQVETPGSHQLALDLTVALAPRGAKGSDRGFDVGLPRAAITVLESFDLAADVPEVRLGSRSVRTKRDGGRTRVEGLSLGPVDRLDLAWRGPVAPPQKGPPVRAARSRAVVRVSDAFVTTDVEMTLEVNRGETSQWQLLVPLPPQATFDLTRPQVSDERIQRIAGPDAREPIVTIQLREPSAEPLQVAFQVRQPRVASAMPIGPFVVLDTFPQRGTIEVRAPADLRLRYQEQGEVSRREVSEDQRREGTVAFFQFWGGQPGQGPRQPAAAPLALEVETVRGAAEARVEQSLRLAPERGWQVTTKIEITPVRTAVDRLEVQAPAGYEYDRDVGPVPAELVEEVTFEPQTRVLHVRLAQKQSRSFSLVLTGHCPRPPLATPPRGDADAGPHDVALELPRPTGWSVEGGVRTAVPVLDRGGHVTVVVPENVALAGRHPHAESPASGSQQYSWPTDRLPARVEFTFQVRRPEIVVDSFVDLHLLEHSGRVRHRLVLRSGGNSPLQVHVPAALARTVRVLEGGKLEQPSAGGEAKAALVFDTPAGGKQPTLVMDYSFPIAQADAPGFAVPLVQPAGTTRGEARVRVWGQPGVQPQTVGDAWEELRTEIVADEDALPDLVVRGSTGAPLPLRSQPARTPLATALVERILVGVTLAPGAQASYRVRFLIRKLHARRLDLEVSLPLRRAVVEVRLDDRRIPATLLDAGGQESETGRTVRLRVEPELYTRPVVLDLRYTLDLNRDVISGFRTTLRPPNLAGALLLGRVRWLVESPPGWQLLPVGPHVLLEQQWGRQGWLLGPVPAASRMGLEQWIGSTTEGVDEHEPTLVAWQTVLEPLPLVYVPQQAWLLVCSLTFLALGLVGLFAPLPRYVLWPMAAAIAAGLLLGGLLAPQLLPALVYGCEPGCLVLLLVAGVQWFLHQRYRRQVLFLPSFTRVKQGSSLVRAGSSNRRREPTTTDEPPQGNSASAERGAG
jgi:hypothetical protein